MRGRSPNAVNARREPDAGSEPDAGPKPNAVNAGLKPDAGPEPDAGPKPNAVNAGSEPDAGPEPDAGLKPNAVNACSIRKKVDRPSGHRSSCRRGRVKDVSGLSAKVGTTRLSCGVGGRAGRPLVIARLAMER
ncbi:hypothetical protein CRG98_030504 [Punica granatum]|uniref:Uncharacterized protein n=1 Tax=Punica granatum TaxID=22663 RepID=A0A2I0IYR6_PUNGR|nr:hypothetical protein CRG98_030504 [Punica granatum]